MLTGELKRASGSTQVFYLYAGCCIAVILRETKKQNKTQEIVIISSKICSEEQLVVGSLELAERGAV